MRTEFLPTPQNWTELKPHPISECVPYGSGVDVDQMAEFMRVHGYDGDEAIVLYQGKILDGRHRHTAAKLAGVTPVFRCFIGQDPIAYVAKKAFRQHLTTSQRAMIAATIRREIGSIEPNYSKPGPKELGGISYKDSGQKMGVSAATVKRAEAIIQKGSDELKAAVSKGEITVNDAASVLKLPKKDQDTALRAARNRQPGDDTDSMREDRKRALLAHHVNGREKFSFHAFDGHFGCLVRALDDIAKAYPSVRTSQNLGACERLLREFRKSWDKVRAETAK